MTDPVLAAAAAVAADHPDVPAELRDAELRHGVVVVPAPAFHRLRAALRGVEVDGPELRELSLAELAGRRQRELMLAILEPTSPADLRDSSLAIAALGSIAEQDASADVVELRERVVGLGMELAEARQDVRAAQADADVRVAAVERELADRARRARRQLEDALRGDDGRLTRDTIAALRAAIDELPA